MNTSQIHQTNLYTGYAPNILCCLFLFCILQGCASTVSYTTVIGLVLEDRTSVPLKDVCIAAAHDKEGECLTKTDSKGNFSITTQGNTVKVTVLVNGRRSEPVTLGYPKVNPFIIRVDKDGGVTVGNQ